MNQTKQQVPSKTLVPVILSGIPRIFFRGVQQIQLRPEGRGNGNLGALAPLSGVALNLQMSETRILIRLLRVYFPRNREFGSALSKLRNLGGVEHLEPPSVCQCAQRLTETALYSVSYVCRNGQTFLGVKWSPLSFLPFHEIVPSRFPSLLRYFLPIQLYSNYFDFRLIYICITVRISGVPRNFFLVGLCQEFFSGGGVQQILLKDRGQRQQESGGGSPLVGGSTQFANE
jgi:hypothetical protein